MKAGKWMLVVLAIFSLLSEEASAQDFPKGPINYMNPFNPGGEVDSSS
jgi:tripartite-type tricarboxylate transporter receptor subunit TctC